MATQLELPDLTHAAPPATQYSAAAREALVAIQASLAGGPFPVLTADVFDELDRAGDLDAWDALEREGWGDDVVDWADPDSFDAETRRWYDAAADPYARGPEPVESCEFFLGTHRPHWLYADGSRERRPAGPLFVSARQLTHARRNAYPVCDTRYAIDSGGFTELRQHGGWVTTPEQYVAQVRALDAQTCTLDWAAIQDWMVEDDALLRTGCTVEEHQRRTTQSFLTLRALAPEIRWLPVIQGQTLDDYVRHIEIYAAAGVHLASMERVGVGSVCRRQASDEIAAILRELAARGLRLHGFGVKTAGLAKAAPYLASSDSLAWSLGARKRFPGAQNSQVLAEEYRDRMLEIPGVTGRTHTPAGATDGQEQYDEHDEPGPRA
jgi:hypothetical protein